MSQDEPTDLAALDSLFSRHGHGTLASAQGLSDERAREIYTGTKSEEEANPTHDTVKALINYEETIPDAEVDEFVSKIRDTRLLDDYPEDDLTPAESGPAPAYNPWPLDEDAPSPVVMADPLSGELLVTDLQANGKAEAEEEQKEADKGVVIASSGVEDPSEADATLSDNDDDDDEDDEEEAEDLTEEFKLEKEKEEAGGVDDGSNDPSSRHHGDEDAVADADKDGDSDNWELIPRLDDEFDGQQKLKDPVDSDTKDSTEDSRNEQEEEEDKVEEEDEEEDEEEEDENEQDVSLDKSGDVSVDKVDPIVDIIVEDADSRTEPELTELDSKHEPSDKDDIAADLEKEVDGKSSKDADEEHETTSRAESPKKKDVPDFETFLQEMGLDTMETLDVEVQKSRARLSRLGPLATRRPITKRFSAGDDKWMFTDSTEPKPQKQTFDEDEEEESTPHRATPPQPAARTPQGAGKRPPGGMGFGPMLLPGLGGAKLKKTPIAAPKKPSKGEEPKVQRTHAEPTKATPLLPSTAKKLPPSPAAKPLKPVTRPQAPPPKEPQQPAWLKELKSKPKDESKRKKEEEGLNSDILHPKASETKESDKQAPPPWMGEGKVKKLPPIPTTSPSSKHKEPPSKQKDPPTPEWKKELKNKKKNPVPTPSNVQKPTTKSPLKPPTQSSPTKSPLQPPNKAPPKPPIARKPELAKSPSIDKPKPADRKREEEKDNTYGVDSKKTKLSQSIEKAADDVKMEIEVSQPVSEPESEPVLRPASEEEKTERIEEQDKDNDKKETEEEELVEDENDEEVKDMKKDEVKVKVVRKLESKKEEAKPPKPEELKVKIIKKSRDLSDKNESEVKKVKIGTKPEVKKDEKKVEKPAKIIPDTRPSVSETKAKKEGVNGKMEEKKTLTTPAVKKTDAKVGEKKKQPEEKKVTIIMKDEGRKEGTGEKRKVSIVTTRPDEKRGGEADLPKWKREALERKQKRKMSGGYAAPFRSSTIETNGNNNTPQWKRDLLEKRKMSVGGEEKGTAESLKSEKAALKRHTIAADIPTISVPPAHHTGVPTWKQDLERRNAKLAKHLATKDAGPANKPPSDQSVETVTSSSS